MTKSPRKNVPDVGIELWTACMPSELASDRATTPGLLMNWLEGTNVSILWSQWSLCMTKPTKWPVHPAKTQISLGICPVWSVFAVCSQSLQKILKDHQTKSGKMIKLLRKFRNIFSRPDEISPDSVRRSCLFQKDCARWIAKNPRFFMRRMSSFVYHVLWLTNCNKFSAVMLNCKFFAREYCYEFFVVVISLWKAEEVCYCILASSWYRFCVLSFNICSDLRLLIFLAKYLPFRVLKIVLDGDKRCLRTLASGKTLVPNLKSYRC